MSFHLFLKVLMYLLNLKCPILKKQKLEGQQLILASLQILFQKASPSLLYNCQSQKTQMQCLKEDPILNQKLFYYEVAYLSFYSVNKDQQSH